MTMTRLDTCWLPLPADLAWLWLKDNQVTTSAAANSHVRSPFSLLLMHSCGPDQTSTGGRKMSWKFINKINDISSFFFIQTVNCFHPSDGVVLCQDVRERCGAAGNTGPLHWPRLPRPISGTSWWFDTGYVFRFWSVHIVKHSNQLIVHLKKEGSCHYIWRKRRIGYQLNEWGKLAVNLK